MLYNVVNKRYMTHLSLNVILLLLYCFIYIEKIF